MPTTYSINVGTVIEATRKTDIFKVLQDLPDNTQKLISPRDVTFFRGIARELVDDVIQVEIILYKLNVYSTKVNLYGESLGKTYYQGVSIYSLVDKDGVERSYEGFGPDASQIITFKLDRERCEEKNIYPEVGDFIFFDTSYYEISNVNEVQFVGGQPYNNYSIVCSAFMSRISDLNIEKRLE